MCVPATVKVTVHCCSCGTTISASAPVGWLSLCRIWLTPLPLRPSPHPSPNPLAPLPLHLFWFPAAAWTGSGGKNEPSQARLPSRRCVPAHVEQPGADRCCCRGASPFPLPALPLPRLPLHLLLWPVSQCAQARIAGRYALVPPSPLPLCVHVLRECSPHTQICTALCDSHGTQCHRHGECHMPGAQPRGMSIARISAFQCPTKWPPWYSSRNWHMGAGTPKRHAVLLSARYSGYLQCGCCQADTCRGCKRSCTICLSKRASKLHIATAVLGPNDQVGCSY